MNTHDENEIKKEFQLERVIFFSDAVFAIIITIMILDVRLPVVERYASEADAKHALIRIIPKLTGYLVSFFAVGRLWVRHLRIFSFLKDYNMRMVIINLIFLFTVSLFPFALSFFFNSGNITQYFWGTETYLVIYLSTVFTETLLAGYLIKHKEELCYNTSEIENTLHWKIKRLDYFLLPGMLGLMVAAAILKLDTSATFYTVMGPFFLFGAMKGRLKRKLYPKQKPGAPLSTILNHRRGKHHPATKKGEFGHGS
jgi:uncharacterized membrane protein